MKKSSPILLLLAIAGTVVCGRSEADPLTARLEKLRPVLEGQFTVPIAEWRFHQPDIAGAEQPQFDDQDWARVGPGYTWPGENSNAWFRARIRIPDSVSGRSVKGMPVRLELGIDDGGELYINGQLKEEFRWDNGRYTLTEQASPGEVFNVAVRGMNRQGTGQLHFARLVFDPMPEFDRYLDEATVVGSLIGRVSGPDRATLQSALDQSESRIHFTGIDRENFEAVRSQLREALAQLAPAAAVTKKFEVFYVGHAHIDMNWLWPWSETIDVCHRTWRSAMNLMDEFPEFKFVQSQPGAYVPIEEKYPKEFSRIQAHVARGQWDPVGGLWNESDTDLPSGEALARSFLLGQRYFKSKFDRYALTGWLPDSFGHSWQLPQIMRLSGLKYFYHMRCGNGMEFTWWQSPDGSRVLKANTPSYDTRPQLAQLAVPALNQARFDLPQSLVVFGVGDHGGGPTREQILRIRSFERDPVLPQIHFASADEFFDQLANQPAAASLPVVDRDLQYTFVGCYTTHADLKQALRRSENDLYTAEVLSSLAALQGAPYPTRAFRRAWEPAVFAQFHDIACGSAIHSTYDWMHEQLAPTFRFAQAQIGKSLAGLTANADTRGPGDVAIAVWNPLSVPRDDVVRVKLQNAAQYHSVADRHGRRFPAQASGRTLVFVARNVPAFGYEVYFPQARACRSDGIRLRDQGGDYDVQTPRLDVRIDKQTGAMTRLFCKAAKWNVFGDARDGDALQLLGDSGNAWRIHYTGQSQILGTEGAKVSVVDQGPVFVRLRVDHAAGQSSYSQDITIYGALPRIDIPTTVNWQEEQTLLKIRLPINARHAEASAEIPFGSIIRPATGRDCPGQKWMDVSETIPARVKHAKPLDLSALFNARATAALDGGPAAYPAGEWPSGTRRLGLGQVPFRFGGSNDLDEIVPEGQALRLPAHLKGDTLYLLGACVRGSHWTDIGFQGPGSSRPQFEAFPLNGRVTNAYPDNEAGMSFSTDNTAAGDRGSRATMWIASVPLPAGSRELIFPRDPQVRFFAATVAAKPATAVPHGLSVLNDCKYGFDFSNHVFRLTALRSSKRPDPEPDRGMQRFTYSLYPHRQGWRAAHTEEQALALNIPLLAKVTGPHPPGIRTPDASVVNIGGRGDLVVSAFKHSEDGRGFILRFYEADGQDTRARVDFDRPMRVEETDILERPLATQSLTMRGNSVILPVGHNRIITLHLVPVSETSPSPES